MSQKIMYTDVRIIIRYTAEIHRNRIVNGQLPIHIKFQNGSGSKLFCDGCYVKKNS